MFHKFPKTPRLSKVLDKEQDLWYNASAVIEEKVDGALVGISFTDGELILQSRRFVLSGLKREEQFKLFREWGTNNKEGLFDLTGNQYVIFGEWLNAKHRIFYDSLPDYLLAFDVFDKENDLFLSSMRRRKLLESSLITSVAEIYRAPFKKVNNFSQYIGNSHYRTSGLMEGIYVKIEDEEKVIGRMKVVRPEFEKVRDIDGPIVQNILVK